MDCEKFESVMLEELYGELDELTAAAAERHVAGCARCSARIGGLRATRRVATVPLAEPPADLEERILLATEQVRVVAPPRARLADVISLAGSWAMRPQTAMAAVFLVMIGTSVLLLRGKSARAPVSAEVTVTEQGTPAPAPSMMPVSPLEPQANGFAITPFPPAAKPAALFPPPAAKEGPAPLPVAAAAPAPMRAYSQPAPAGPADEQSDDPFEAALRSYRAGRFKEAARAFDALPLTDPNAPDLWAARSVRDGKGGCRAAVARFDRTAQRYKQTAPGWDALLEGALCYRSLGELGTARARLSALLNVDSHKDRARAELDRIDDAQQAQATSDAPASAREASKPRTGVAASAQPAPTAPVTPAEAAGAAAAPNH